MGNTDFIELPEIFQDGMVLQRGKPVRLWKTSMKAQTLTVLLDGETVAAAEAPEGAFAIILPPQKAAEDRTPRIRNEDGAEFVLHDVDFGEVWIIGGHFPPAIRFL